MDGVIGRPSIRRSPIRITPIAKSPDHPTIAESVDRQSAMCYPSTFCLLPSLLLYTHPVGKSSTFYKSFSEKKLTTYGSSRRGRIERHRLALLGRYKSAPG